MGTRSSSIYRQYSADQDKVQEYYYNRPNQNLTDEYIVFGYIRQYEAYVSKEFIPKVVYQLIHIYTSTLLFWHEPLSIGLVYNDNDKRSTIKHDGKQFDRLNAFLLHSYSKGIVYIKFKLHAMSRRHKTRAFIGIVPVNHAISNAKYHVGCLEGSIAYDLRSGKICKQGKYNIFGDPMYKNDEMIIVLNFNKKIATFYKNDSEKEVESESSGIKKMGYDINIEADIEYTLGVSILIKGDTIEYIPYNDDLLQSQIKQINEIENENENNYDNCNDDKNKKLWNDNEAKSQYFTPKSQQIPKSLQTCSSCGERKSKCYFSNSQLRKPTNQRRCDCCVVRDE